MEPMAFAVRADGSNRPCGARQIVTSIRMDAENPACCPCAMMHAPSNSKLQRNRLGLRRLRCPGRRTRSKSPERRGPRSYGLPFGRHRCSQRSYVARQSTATDRCQRAGRQRPASLRCRCVGKQSSRRVLSLDPRRSIDVSIQILANHRLKRPTKHVSSREDCCRVLGRDACRGRPRDGRRADGRIRSTRRRSARGRVHRASDGRTTEGRLRNHLL